MCCPFKTRLAVQVEAGKAPQFSWRFATPATGQAGGRNLHQATYRITVSQKSGETVWDSGVVASTDTVHVAYAGDNALKPDGRYHWRVTTAPATARGAASTMPVASGWRTFATAIPASLWDTEHAQWIGDAAGGTTQLRTEFALPAAVHSELAHASLFMATAGYGRVWVNGAEVGAEEALGPWTTWSVPGLRNRRARLPCRGLPCHDCHRMRPYAGPSAYCTSART